MNHQYVIRDEMSRNMSEFTSPPIEPFPPLSLLSVRKRVGINQTTHKIFSEVLKS